VSESLGLWSNLYWVICHLLCNLTASNLYQPKRNYVNCLHLPQGWAGSQQPLPYTLQRNSTWLPDMSSSSSLSDRFSSWFIKPDLAYREWKERGPKWNPQKIIFI